MKGNKVTRGFGIFESYLAKKRAQKAESLIKSSQRKGRVLDIGCGSFPHFLASTNFKEKFGLDSSVKEDNFNGSEIKIIKMNAGKKEMPFDKGFFECVTMLAVFEHIKTEDLSFVLKEIKRILSPKGSFIMTTPAPWSNNILWFLSRIGLISKVEIDDHKHALSPQNIENLLREAGFKKTKKGFFELGLNLWFLAEK